MWVSYLPNCGLHIGATEPYYEGTAENEDCVKPVPVCDYYQSGNIAMELGWIWNCNQSEGEERRSGEQ